MIILIVIWKILVRLITMFQKTISIVFYTTIMMIKLTFFTKWIFSINYHDDFKLGPKTWSKLCITNYKAQEWELYDNVCVFNSVQIEKMEIDLLDIVQEYCDMEEKNRKFTYFVGKKDFVFYLFGKKQKLIYLTN